MTNSAPPAPDRLHWLFDFDLTLYGYDEEFVLLALDRNISRFVMARLGISEEAANALRREYWQEFGTTLNGLRQLHGVNETEYFDFIHEGGTLVSPRFAPEKRQLLLQLPGRRWVFTNARRDWAERGLRAMGIADCFEGIFDIECFGWRSKPDPTVYTEIEHRIEARGPDLILVDDRTVNLGPARERGWRTVFVHPEAEEQSVDCDLKLASILELGAKWPLLAKEHGSL